MFVTETLLTIEIKKTEMLMNKPIYLGLSILEFSKIVMYDFWYDYVKPKYGEKAKLCYMDTDSFTAYVKKDENYNNIVEDVETRFDTSNYELDKAFPKRNKNTLTAPVNCKKTTRHHAHLSLCAKSRKTNDEKLRKWLKTSIWAIFGQF